MLKIHSLFFSLFHSSPPTPTLDIMGDIKMWVIILFGLLIVVFTTMTVEDQLRYKDYPIIDQYWISGLILVGFIASLIAMIFI